MIETLPLAKCHKAELVKLEGLSAQQLDRALTLATLTAGRSRKRFARHLLVATTRSQKALARRGKDEARVPITRYSLDYIHAAGRFGPAQILQALRRRPQGSLCLYGLSGTGKTQFAEHVALELGKPILIKHASELFDKYVGESEKRIAEAFDQAEEDGAILLLDEADSFLRDRSRSTHSWEVSPRHGRVIFDIKGIEGRGEYGLLCATADGLFVAPRLSGAPELLVPTFRIPEGADKHAAARVLAAALHALGWGPEVDQAGNIVDSTTYVLQPMIL